MAISSTQFNRIKKGDRIAFCADGDFTVTGVHKDGEETVKLTIRSTEAGHETMTLDPGDAFLIDLL